MQSVPRVIPFERKTPATCRQIQARHIAGRLLMFDVNYIPGTTRDKSGPFILHLITATSNSIFYFCVCDIHIETFALSQARAALRILSQAQSVQCVKTRGRDLFDFDPTCLTSGVLCVHCVRECALRVVYLRIPVLLHITPRFPRF